MKKLALLALLLSLGVSTVGCDKKKEAPKTDAGAPPATTPPAETK
jgi:hypothetical protein